MNLKMNSILGLTFVAWCAPLAYANTTITEAEVKAAQDAWGKALIQISSDYEKSGLEKAKTTAKTVLDTAYGYNITPVLFKPTLATGAQTFRPTYQGALSYFVGDDKNFPADTGFALKGWIAYDYKNAAVYINGDMALTMGHVMLRDKNGKVTTVDKSWGFKKDADGKLRIVLHHSSLPYQPQ
ncbi:phosphoribosyl-AMP cyclohydrolase [Rheinheimera sediminis]|uniref:phosphoribosyl-AMP cyclohydrolase n=1 Tax=Rheinheimera sp. YQF-1 TaxID=2499626 RepID=UPI000FDA6D15|nr:phosphoribosyl-AMP cyclohydrolase [Rheinheimera sp. YQF-1]RVT49061.1 phosphoribosyl-AMP cyclohydrolase [Rheinheimera sp. YQF-1]